MVEELTYKPRFELHNQIVNVFRRRRDSRVLHGKGATDKNDNPFIALPATAGSGKSTELVHFPASAAYQEFCDHPDEFHAPIVSLLTFNSGMEGGPISIGLRILFGALACMNLLLNQTWDEFCSQPAACDKHITAVDAVNMLRRVLGQDRRVLVCVDELSKAANGEDAVVMIDLGSLLTRVAVCDVLVTALSPQYVTELVSGSHRPIKYLPIQPLEGDVDECRDAVKHFLNRKMKGKNVEIGDYKRRILRSAYLLASGHPRTLEYLAKELLQGDKKSERMFRALWNKNTDAAQFIKLVCGLTCFELYTNVPTDATELDFVLSISAHNPQNSPMFRKSIERNLVKIYEGIGNSFRVTTSLAAFFSAVEVAQPIAPGSDLVQIPTSRAIALLTHFKTLFETEGLELNGLWERSRALAVVVNGLHIRRKFGVLYDSGLSAELFTTLNEVRLISNTEDFVPYVNGVLFVGRKEQKGFDLALCGTDASGLPAMLYEEVKLDLGASPFPLIVAKKIRLTLSDHFQHRHSGCNVEESDEFRRIAIVFSRFVDESTELMESLEAPDTVVGLMETEEQKESDIDKKQEWQRARRYALQVWGENVGFLGKAQLVDSMVPATLPFAELVRNLEL